VPTPPPRLRPRAEGARTDLTTADASLPLRAKSLYALSSLGGEALAQSRGAWLLYLYAPPDDADLPELLPTVVVGVLLAAGRLLEALDDALVGWWSDRTRSRLGRRIPFVLAATPLWALFGFLLFSPPPAGTAATAVWFFLVLELFFFFGTLSGGPYEALLPEIARTTPERLSVIGLRVYLGAAGAAVGLVVSGLLVDTVGFQAMALVMAVLALTTRYLGLAGVWRHAQRDAPPAAIPFRSAVRETFSNRHFLRFLPSFVLFQIGFQLLVGVLPFYVNAVLGVEDEGTWVAVLTAVAIATMVASVPGFAALARRTSKRRAYGLAMLGAAASFSLVGVAGLLPGLPAEAQILPAMVLVGVPLAGVYLFPAALTADIIDEEIGRTGLRREATYYGTQNFVEKTATSASPLILALLLLLGDSADDPTGIHLVGPVAGLAVLLGWLAFRRYDLPDDPAAKPPVREADQGKGSGETGRFPQL
jgi:glycoside/pentoside/hexuronide:cation symporter, GPH family